MNPKYGFYSQNKQHDENMWIWSKRGISTESEEDD